MSTPIVRFHRSLAKVSRKLRGGLLGAGVAGLSLLGGYQAQAATWTDIDMLASALMQVGTKVSVVRQCNRKGLYGFYEPRADKIVLCMNNINHKDPDAVWDTLAHEATHKMQACRDGFALPDSLASRMYRDLGSLKPASIKDLQAYPSTQARYEVEARWMELQQPHVVVKLLKLACDKASLNGPGAGIGGGRRNKEQPFPAQQP